MCCRDLCKFTTQIVVGVTAAVSAIVSGFLVYKSKLEKDITDCDFQFDSNSTIKSLKVYSCSEIDMLDNPPVLLAAILYLMVSAFLLIFFGPACFALHDEGDERFSNCCSNTGFWVMAAILVLASAGSMGYVGIEKFHEDMDCKSFNENGAKGLYTCKEIDILHDDLTALVAFGFLSLSSLLFSICFPWVISTRCLSTTDSKLEQIPLYPHKNGSARTASAFRNGKNAHGRSQGYGGTNTDGSPTIVESSA